MNETEGFEKWSQTREVIDSLCETIKEKILTYPYLLFSASLA